MSTLHCAAAKGQLKIIEYLVDHDADLRDTDEVSICCEFIINFVSKLLKTPLHSACEFGHLDIVEYLLIQGVDINATDSVS